jgi:hypothetical protein
MAEKTETARGPKTQFGAVIKSLTSPEGMNSVVLPLAAIFETVATKGQSPGKVAAQQQEILQRGMKSSMERDQLMEQKRADELERREKAVAAKNRRDIEDSFISAPASERGQYAIKMDPQKAAGLEIDRMYKEPVIQEEPTQQDIDWVNRTFDDPDTQRFMLNDLKLLRKTRAEQAQIEAGIKVSPRERLEVYEGRQGELGAESRYRLASSESRSYESSPVVQGARAAKRYHNAAYRAIEMDSPVGDQILVKALEKMIQEGAVLQGESDAYRNAGNLLSKIKSSGVYEAVVNKGLSRLDPTYQESMISLIDNMNEKMMESYNKYRSNKITLGERVFSWDRPTAEAVYSDINEGEEQLGPQAPQSQQSQQSPQSPQSQQSPQSTKNVRVFRTPEEAEASGYKGRAIVGGRKVVIE